VRSGELTGLTCAVVGWWDGEKRKKTFFIMKERSLTRKNEGPKEKKSQELIIREFSPSRMREDCSPKISTTTKEKLASA